MVSAISADARPLRLHSPPDVSFRASAVARLGALLRQRRRLYRTPGLGGVGELYRAARGALPGGDVRRRLPRVPSARPALARHALAPNLVRLLIARTACHQTLSNGRVAVGGASPTTA